MLPTVGTAETVSDRTCLRRINARTAHNSASDIQGRAAIPAARSFTILTGELA
jgi:hypothetical protein